MNLKHFFQEVNTINCKGAAVGELLLTKNSFPIFNINESIYCGATEFFQGKAFAFGHDLLLNEDQLNKSDNFNFLINIIKWICPKKKDNYLILNIGGDRKYLSKIFYQKHINLNIKNIESTFDINLSNYDIIIFGQIGSIPNNMKNKEFNDIIQFVKNGGGIIGANAGWVWNHYGDGNKKFLNLKLTNDFISNKIFKPFGIEFKYEFQMDLIFSPPTIYLIPKIEEFKIIEKPKIIEESKIIEPIILNEQKIIDNNLLINIRKKLLNNVNEIDCGDAVFSHLTLINDNSIPIIYGLDGKIIASITIYGKGKIFNITHGIFISESFINQKSGFELWKNLLIFMNYQNKNQLKLFHYNFDCLTCLNNKFKNIKFKLKNNNIIPNDLNQYDILLFNYYGSINKDFNQNVLNNIIKYVENGGNIISAAPAWVWLYYGDGKDKSLNLSFYKDFFSNFLMKPFGIFYNDDYSTFPNNIKLNTDFSNNEKLLKNYIDNLINKLLNSSLTIKDINENILQILSSKSFDHYNNFCTEQSITKLFSNYNFSNYLPNPYDDDDEYQKDIIKEFLYKFFYLISDCVPFNYLISLNPSSLFPGKCDSNLINQNYNLKLGINKISFTSFYANPGQIINIKINDDSLLFLSIKIVIGMGDDLTDHEVTRKRHPNIIKTFILNKKNLSICSPYGGIIYFILPDNIIKDNKNYLISFENIILTPFYNENIHSIEEFYKIQQYPGPWSILEYKKICFVFKCTDYFRKLKNINEISNFWNKIMDCYSDLSNKPSKENVYDKQIIMSDIMISLGYMHSGNPIMTFDDVIDNYLGFENKIFKEGNWGLYHEIGHNHQESEWTYSTGVEVTVNLFTLYVMYKIHNIIPLKHDWFNGKDVFNKMNNYFKNGSNYNNIEEDYQLLLLSYALLIDEFGFDSIKKTFQFYLNDNSNTNYNSDKIKMEKWVINYSNIIKKNLYPYFKKWGWDINSNINNLLKNYPIWYHKLMNIK